MIEREVQARMSDAAGLICTARDVRESLAQARALNARIGREGVVCGRAHEAARAVQWRQMAIASEAVLTALEHYIRGGGGSRGARAICDPSGESTPMAQGGPLTEFRFLAERAHDRETRIFVRYSSGSFSCETRPIRRRDRGDAAFFERDWPRFLSGAIYEQARSG